jgi:chromosomal replication initiator protein
VLSQPPPLPSCTFETFVVSDASRAAFMAAVDVAEERFDGALFLHGPTGSGKSHLLRAIEHRMHGRRPEARIVRLATEQVIVSLLGAIRLDEFAAFRDSFHTIDALLLDDFPLWPGLENTRTEIVLRIEELLGRGAQAVVVCPAPPRGMRLPEQTTLVEVGYPDKPARLEIARRAAAARGLMLPDEALDALAARLTTPRELQSAIACLALEAMVHTRRA